MPGLAKVDFDDYLWDATLCKPTNNLGLQPLIGNEHRNILLVFPIFLTKIQKELVLLQKCSDNEVSGYDAIVEQGGKAYISCPYDQDGSGVPGVTDHTKDTRSIESIIFREGRGC